jgi:hypothetical protein
MESFMKRILLFAFQLLCASFALSACATPLTYSAKEIRGQIVDAATGQPVEGAIVVAQWVLSHIGSGHYGTRLHVQETVSDKDGNYVIPAWGPRPRPPLTDLIYRDPQILIFKSGYEPEGLENSKTQTDSVRVSEWDGKVIKLKRVSSQENLERYASRLNSFYGGLVENMRSDYEWKKYPRMTTAVYKEYQLLKAKRLRVYRPSIPYIEGFIEP